MFDQSLYKEVTANDLMQNPMAIIDLEKDRMTDVMKNFKIRCLELARISKDRYYGFVSKSKLLTAYQRKLLILPLIK